MSDLDIGLLGSFQATLNEQPLNKFRTSKVQALLIYLAVEDAFVNHPLTHRREALMTLLWPDLPSAAAQTNLRQTLYHLRQALPELAANSGDLSQSFLLTDRQTVQINPLVTYALDVAAFTRHIHCYQTHPHPDVLSCAACQEQLQAAVTLYRGDFLADFYLPDSNPFEEWALVKRELFRRQALDALHTLTAIYLGQRAYEPAQALARRQLELDNLREIAYRQLMAALARHGQCGEALAQYNHCCRILAKELNIQPAVETIALAEAIQQGRIQSPLPQPNRHAQPIQSMLKPLAPPEFRTSLVGRTVEMDTLRRVWQQVGAGQGRMILVEGEPGIGKTRLIEELLGQVTGQAVILRAKCPEMKQPLAYTLFVPPLRHALAQALPTGLSDAWLVEVSRLLPEMRDRYPNLPQPPHLTPAAERRRLFDAICGTLLALAEPLPLVFFVDDLQWADATSLALLSHLSEWGGDAPVLVIGAYRPHEVGPNHPLQQTRAVWQRGGHLTTLPLVSLSDQAVATLLQELTTWPGDDPAFGNLIYRETGGNPLFVIETVVSLQEQGCLPQRIEDWQHNFHLDRVEIPHQVQLVINQRFKQLTSASRHLLTTVSVLRSSFSVEMAQAVSGQSEQATLAGLECLLASGLLVEQDGGRCTFSHDRIREVAYTGLSSMRRRRMHRRVAEILEERYQHRENTIIERLAYHWDRAEEPEQAIRYLLRAGEQTYQTYAHDETLTYFQRALDLLGTLFRDEAQNNWRLQALKGLGQIYHYSGRLAESETYFRKVIILGREMGLDSRELLLNYCYLIATLWHQGKYDEQIEVAREGLSLVVDTDTITTMISREIVVPFEAALMLDCIATACMAQENMETYRQYAYQAARSIISYCQSHLPDSVILSTAYCHITWECGIRKDIKEALKWLEKLEATVILQKDLVLLGETYRTIGMVNLAWMGNLHSATTKLQQAQKLSTLTGEYAFDDWCLGNLAESFLLQGNLDQAETFAIRSLEVANALGKKDDIAWCYGHLGRVSLTQDKKAQAVDAFQQTVRIYKEIGHHIGEVWGTYLVGWAYLVEENQVAASEQFQLAINLMKPTDLLGYIYRAPGNIAWYPLIACVLSGLEAAAENPTAFRAFCQHWRMEHPEVDDAPFVQWYLEPADIGTIGQSPLVYDDFSRTLNPAWQWQDEFDDCSFTIQSGLKIRAANGRDLWHLNMSAPHLVRPVSGDFVMQTACLPVDDRPAIGGLVVWQNRANFLRLDRGMWGQGEIFFGGARQNEDIMIGRGRLDVDKIFLRLERHGEEVNAFCSQDGANWFTVGYVKFPVKAPLKVGVHAIGHIDRTIYCGAYPAGTAIRFESFQLELLGFRL